MNCRRYIEGKWGLCGKPAKYIQRRAWMENFDDKNKSFEELFVCKEHVMISYKDILNEIYWLGENK